MTPPSALIFGAGQSTGVGAAVVKAFLAAGYRVAAVSRSAPSPSQQPPSSSNDDDDDTFVRIQADLSDPSTIPTVYAQLPPRWRFPSVVVWNAFAASPPAATDPENPFAVPEADFDRDLRLMIKSPYVAAREAVKAWTSAEGGEGDNFAEKGRKGTFIMTGNMCAVQVFPVPALTTLGVGKAGAHYWLGCADAVLKEKGVRFFFADERNAEGLPIGPNPNGDDHAKLYLHLAEGGDDLPHYVSFRDGKYQKF